MSYTTIEYDVADVELPDTVRQFIDEADRRCEQFYDAKLNKRYPRYVPSEPAQVYAALEFVTDRELPLGTRFIEWGSGFGVATGLAALLGYEATGIEIQDALVDKARALLEDQNIDADFLCLSYVPEGFIHYDALGGDDLIPDDNFGNACSEEPQYEGMDAPISEVDLFFAYPWPGEQEMILKLFDAVAGEGALLIAYYGDRDLCIYRKLSE